jgi:hypothetical protein
MTLTPPRSRVLFLVALATLVAHDWIVRPAGVLPALVNGKLSDAAIMLVAPVVLAALLVLARVPPRPSGVAAGMVVGGLFTVVKLSAWVAAAYDRMLGALAGGLPVAARTTVDATDLLVLPLLGLGVVLAIRLAGDCLWRPLVRGAGLGLGLLATAATSYSHAPVTAHWGLADRQLNSTWVGRLEGGVVVVRLGRYTPDHHFEVDIHLTATGGAALGLPLEQVRLELSGTGRVPARVPGGALARLEARPGTPASGRVWFEPARRDWLVAAPGLMQLPIEVLATGGSRPVLVEVPLRFDERLVSWSESRRRFGQYPRSR